MVANKVRILRDKLKIEYKNKMSHQSSFYHITNSII